MSNSDPVKLGVLFSREGVTSRIENSMLLGTLFAIREINDAGGLNGRELVPVYYDPHSSPQMFKSLTTRLVLEDKVNVIFGCYMSSTRKAILPVVEKWNRLLFCPTMYEGFEFSGNVIYTGGAPNQNSALLADYMASRFGARVYMVGSDYIFPYESNRIMSDFVHQRQGGAKPGERYVRLDAQESAFAPIIKDIQANQPDFIFSTVVGRTTRMFYQAFADAGLDPARMPIASLCTSEEEIAEMGTRIAEGHYTAGPYFQSIDTERNRSCLAHFRKLFGSQVEPNMSRESSYNQVHLFAGAFVAANSDERDVLLPHLLGMEFDAPQGRIRVNPNNHHTRLFPRIGRVNDSGQFTILAETLSGVEPDPYLVSHSFDDWSNRLRVAVLHPKDEDGETLTQQLQRIGCQVQTFWPPVPDLPDNVDLVFCAVDQDVLGMSFNWVRQAQPPAVIVIISYENPTIFDAMIKLGATGVLTAPIRSTGILSTLVLTVGLNEAMRKAEKRVLRLEQKLLGINQINEAKSILMRTRNVGDSEAYRIIREQAMSRRVPTEEIARAIIHANSILSGPTG